ncbi:hypothetical protein CgunFtcFv8_007855 [Champsocephalus gunnari]|uniref:Uncharacterized protein n=1 Tax=Champsocephalus gunnari TaxID=52237 RepID=A0AAN8HF20_CHAGU|nr:hypothetical protein CgunFtcFv8_007855 [Champsocephalus gunnari]
MSPCLWTCDVLLSVGLDHLHVPCHLDAVDLINEIGKTPKMNPIPSDPLSLLTRGRGARQSLGAGCHGGETLDDGQEGCGDPDRTPAVAPMGPFLWPRWDPSCGPDGTHPVDPMGPILWPRWDPSCGPDGTHPVDHPEAQMRPILWPRWDPS